MKRHFQNNKIKKDLIKSEFKIIIQKLTNAIKLIIINIYINIL